jgi:hypothetical protein
MQTAKPPVPEASVYEFEMAIGKVIRHKSPRIDQITTELIKAGGRTIRSEIHKLISYFGDKKKLPEQGKKLIIAPIYKKGDKSECSNYTGILLLSTTYKILSIILLSRLTPYGK